MARLVDTARVIRSKNAKPFVLTVDILFDNEEAYRRAATSPSLSASAIADVYELQPASVEVIPYPAALAMKITMRRWVPAGSFKDRDLHGAQQAVLLYDLDVDEQSE